MSSDGSFTHSAMHYNVPLLGGYLLQVFPVILKNLSTQYDNKVEYSVSESLLGSIDVSVLSTVCGSSEFCIPIHVYNCWTW